MGYSLRLIAGGSREPHAPRTEEIWHSVLGREPCEPKAFDFILTEWELWESFEQGKAMAHSLL